MIIFGWLSDYLYDPSAKCFDAGNNAGHNDDTNISLQFLCRKYFDANILLQAIMLLKTLIPRKGELVRPVSSASMVIKCEQHDKDDLDDHDDDDDDDDGGDDDDYLHPWSSNVMIEMMMGMLQPFLCLYKYVYIFVCMYLYLYVFVFVCMRI